MSFSENLLNKKPNKSISIKEMVDATISGEINGINFKSRIEDIRSLSNPWSDAKDAIKKIKLELPCVYISGFWNDKKIDSSNPPTEYTGYQHVDFDLEDNEKYFFNPHLILEFMKFFPAYPFIVFAAPSPSGKGLKVVVYVGKEAEPIHKEVYLEVVEFFKVTFKLNADLSCSDVTRAMLLTYHPNPYFRETTIPFNYKTTIQDKTEISTPVDRDLDDKTLERVNRCVSEITKGRLNIAHSYSDWDAIARSLSSLGESGREHFHMIAKQSPKYKKEENDAKFSYYLNKGTRASIGTFFFHFKQHGLTIKNNNMTETNELKFRMIGNEKKDEVEKEIFCPPHLSKELIDNLPSLLSTKHLGEISQMEESLYVLAAIQTFSTVIDNVQILHGGKSYFPNMFVFGVGNAGSGKSIIHNCFPLNQAINGFYDEIYDEELKAYKRSIRNKEEDNDEDIEVPKRKIHTIPADTSNAALMDILNTNGGTGNLIDTEADSSIGSRNQDWKNNDATLRKCASNEPLQANRKGGGVIFIDRPKAGFLITGTYDQFIALFKGSVENGLISRFIFFFLGQIDLHFDPRVFDNIQFHKKIETIKELSMQCRDLFEKIHKSSEIYFEINKPKHLAELKKIYPEWHSDAIKLFGNDIHATVNRFAITHKRIAAVLCILRAYDEDNFSDNFLNNPGSTINLSCDDTSFNQATEIMNVIREHNFYLFQYLKSQKPEDDNQIDHTAMRALKLLNNLPEEFKKSESNEIGLKLGYAERTVGKHLKFLVDKGLIESDGIGNYKKIRSKSKN